MAVLGHLKGIVGTSDGWSVIMTDFELALRNACRIQFPSARLSGCDVHFKRVSYKSVKIFCFLGNIM